jgi:hypothetical protein
MLTRTFALAAVFAALAACGRPQEPVAADVTPRPAALGEARKVSAVPEHFDRKRAEQFEREEERLRRRSRGN